MEVILFVGSNPSNASADETAFHASTKSNKILASWCKDIIGEKIYINVLDKKTEGNRPLKLKEIKSNLDRLAEDINRIAPTRIIALGKTSSTALTLLGLKFFELPHPSGCNRLLNNPIYVSQKIKKLVEYCNPTSLEVSKV